MTCDNRCITSAFDLPDHAMLFLRRLFSRLRYRPNPQPWVYERLATPEEIVELRKTELRRAA